MLIEIIQILYYIVFFVMSMLSAFIVFHMVRYSYTAASKTAMLAIFLPVVCVLLITNFILFSTLPFDRIFASMLP